MIYSFYRNKGIGIHLVANESFDADADAVARAYELCKEFDIEVRLYGRRVCRLAKGSKPPQETEVSRP